MKDCVVLLYAKGNNMADLNISLKAEPDTTGMGAPKPMASPSILKSRSVFGLDVAVVGAKESLSHQALMSIFDGDEKLNVTYTSDFSSLFRLIQSGDVHSGVVPIENTSIGPMPGIYDLLLKYPEIKIIGEHIVAEDHCLCAREGTKIEDIDRITAHPWAGEQCNAYLTRLAKQAPKPILRVIASDTAAACKMAQERANTATIQQRPAAETMGLTVLAEGISNDENNKTRFVLLSKEEIAIPHFENMSTTVAFALRNTTNSMFKAIAVFGMRDIPIRRMVTVCYIFVDPLCPAILWMKT